MPYTIFTPAQILPATVTRMNAQEQIVVRENPEQITLPAGTTVLYKPPGYSRFSADPALRSLLLNDPTGTATLAQVTAAFPEYIAALNLKTEKDAAAAAVKAALVRLTAIQNDTNTTTAEAVAAIKDMAGYLKHIIKIVA